MLFSWGTRAYTWYANDLQAQPGYLPFVHFPLILISLAIGGYLAHLGIKGRKATRRPTPSALGDSVEHLRDHPPVS